MKKVFPVKIPKKTITKSSNKDYKLLPKIKGTKRNRIELLYLFLFFILLIIIIFLFRKIKRRGTEKKGNLLENDIYLDQYETNIYDRVKEKIKQYKCSLMWANQREFLNGVVRKFKPKKIVEIGVAAGAGSIIILNALQDIENSHLYSIDLDASDNVGSCLKNHFPELLNKWTLFKGDVAAKYMEQIGNNIDMLFIDSAHVEPGEILDFIIALPFLKENAIVGIHDIGNQITYGPHIRREWAPYIIFNMIRGKQYLPSGNKQLTHDIGIKILDNNQKQYYHDYFRALGGQWQYFPKAKHLLLIKEYFQKYYDEVCLLMFNETVEFNRKFVKDNPMDVFYKDPKEY